MMLLGRRKSYVTVALSLALLLSCTGDQQIGSIDHLVRRTDVRPVRVVIPTAPIEVGLYRYHTMIERNEHLRGLGGIGDSDTASVAAETKSEAQTSVAFLRDAESRRRDSIWYTGSLVATAGEYIDSLVISLSCAVLEMNPFADDEQLRTLFPDAASIAEELDIHPRRALRVAVELVALEQENRINDRDLWVAIAENGVQEAMAPVIRSSYGLPEDALPVADAAEIVGILLTMKSLGISSVLSDNEFWEEHNSIEEARRGLIQRGLGIPVNDFPSGSAEVILKMAAELTALGLSITDIDVFKNAETNGIDAAMAGALRQRFDIKAETMANSSYTDLVDGVGIAISLGVGINTSGLGEAIQQVQRGEMTKAEFMAAYGNSSSGSSAAGGGSSNNENPPQANTDIIDVGPREDPEGNRNGGSGSGSGSGGTADNNGGSEAESDNGTPDDSGNSGGSGDRGDAPDPGSMQVPASAAAENNPFAPGQGNLIQFNNIDNSWQTESSSESGGDASTESGDDDDDDDGSNGTGSSNGAAPAGSGTDTRPNPENEYRPQRKTWAQMSDEERQMVLSIGQAVYNSLVNPGTAGTDVGSQSGSQRSLRTMDWKERLAPYVYPANGTGGGIPMPIGAGQARFGTGDRLGTLPDPPERL